MKKWYLSFLLALTVGQLSTEAVYAQQTQTLVIQPDAQEGKDAYLNSRVPNKNLGQHPDLDALALNYGKKGQKIPVTVRGLVAFDLSAIPADAQIVKAELNLFNNDRSVNISGKQIGKNQATLTPVTEAWEEASVTWANQPRAAAASAVTLAKSTDRQQHYLDIDVTEHVREMHADPEANHGWLLRLLEEKRYRSLIFASSDHEDASLRPMLSVSYQLPVSNNAAANANANTLGTANDINMSAFPNPFSDQLAVTFELTEAAEVSITLHDKAGRLVQHIDYGMQEAGNHMKRLLPLRSFYANGMYVLNVQVGESSFTQQVLYTK